MDSGRELVITPGDKLLACHRRLFEKDEPRYFTGEVISSSDAVVKVRGYSHCRDLNTGHFEWKDEVRTKIISVFSGAYILYELPSEVTIHALRIVTQGTRTTLSSDDGFSLDLTEYSGPGSLYRR